MLRWLVANRDSTVVHRLGGIFVDISRTGSAKKANNLSGIGAFVKQALFSPLDPRRAGEVHKWMYDELSLRQLHERAGFGNTKLYDHLSGSVPNWNRFELDNLADGSPLHNGSVWLEANK
jgi:hypothetical protein